MQRSRTRAGSPSPRTSTRRGTAWLRSAKRSTEGAKALSANNTQTAARAARLGQDALGQGTAFLDGIDRLATQLDEAKAKVDQMLVDADADLAQAKKAAAGSADAALAARLAQADTLLAGARTALAGPKPDVAAAFAQARDAHTIADDILATLRTAAEQLARNAARLDASIQAAQATVTRATDFIATRRGAVGTEARTRLAEAQRHLDQAVAAGATDPVGAIREADQATALANAAYQAATDDYGRYDDPWHGGGRGGGGGAGIGGNIAGRAHRRHHRRHAERRGPGRIRRLRRGWVRRRLGRWLVRRRRSSAGAAARPEAVGGSRRGIAWGRVAAHPGARLDVDGDGSRHRSGR